MLDVSTLHREFFTTSLHLIFAMNKLPRRFTLSARTSPFRSFSTSRQCLADHVRIVEVGPRDGLQNEKTSISLDTKLELIRRLAQTGVTHLEAGSFVPAKWVPQVSCHGVERASECWTGPNFSTDGINCRNPRDNTLESTPCAARYCLQLPRPQHSGARGSSQNIHRTKGTQSHRISYTTCLAAS